MNRCPKCGSFEISGPKYRKVQWGSTVMEDERLWYRCLRCGYEESRPTLDHVETPK
jgi:DNA-directed RNA polymerase subunit RPC12/RpoP